MGLLGGFVLLSYLYLGVSALTLYRVVRGWRALFDRQLTPDDAHLATSAAFFLLLPPLVALHEAGHAAAVVALGGEVLKVAFYGFMGAVWHASMGPRDDFFVALAGNLVTVLLGAAVLGWALLRPGHPVSNILRIELARQALFLELVLYPVLCLFTHGDFRVIYDFGATPLASGLTAGAHALILAVGWGWWWRRRALPRARALCGPGAFALVETERALARDPTDVAAQRALGLAWGRAGVPRQALRYLAPLVERGGAEVELAVGVALADSARPAEARVHLERAAEVPQPDLRGRALVALAGVRLALGERDAAREAAQEALRLRLTEPGLQADLRAILARLG